jgi:hypothetical protein
MARHRRRNKVVIWEWSRAGRHTEPRIERRRGRSVVRDAFVAAALLGVIILVLSMVPPDSDGRYRRDRLARSICELAGVDPAAPQCVPVAIVGWWVIVVALGVTLKGGSRVFGYARARRNG